MVGQPAIIYINVEYTVFKKSYQYCYRARPLGWQIGSG